MKKKKKSSATKDREFQTLIKSIYKTCLLCNTELTCGHHFIHKSQSKKLRYDIKNILPVCKKHHYRIHRRNNPLDILLIIDKMKELHGQGWLEYVRQNI